MTDLLLFWSGEDFAADLLLADGDLARDAGLRSAVIVSLFTDRRARSDDILPQQGADPRGWWPDALGDPDDQIGSRLWLLSREKQLPTVLAKARDYVMEALAWLVRDGVASSVEVEAEVSAPGVLGLAVFITRPDGPDRQRFDFVWKGL